VGKKSFRLAIALSPETGDGALESAFDAQIAALPSGPCAEAFAKCLASSMTLTATKLQKAKLRASLAPIHPWNTGLAVAVGEGTLRVRRAEFPGICGLFDKI